MNSDPPLSVPCPTEDLVEMSLRLWLRSDWKALCEIDKSQIDRHPSRRALVLYRVAAHHQLGDDAAAREWVRAAIAWNCDVTCLSSILIACARSTLCHAGFQSKKHSRVNLPAASSAILGEAVPNAGVLGEAAEVVSMQVRDVENRLSTHENVIDLANQLTVIKSELGILKQSFHLNQTRDRMSACLPKGLPRMRSLKEQEEAWRNEIASMSTSQLGQDLWVLEKCSFKRNGFFVEFGATDGIVLSNTFLLEKAFGWNGICAEPNPKSFSELERNRLCMVSCDCIGAISGEQVEFIFADAYGGMARDADCDKHKAKRDAYKGLGESSILSTVSLHEFLISHNAPKGIDYISIDTEGSEYSILEKFPFHEWDVRLFTIEHNYTAQRASIRELLLSNGYQCQESQWDDWYFKP